MGDKILYLRKIDVFASRATFSFQFLDFHLIRWIRRIEQNHPYVNRIQLQSHINKKHSSVMVRVADS